MSQPPMPAIQSAIGKAQSQIGGPLVEADVAGWRSFFSDWGLWIIAFAGAIAVIAGLVTTIAEKEIAASMERRSNERIAIAEGEVNAAKERTAKLEAEAAITNERAANAERDAVQAKALAASLEKETAIARTELARANERAASLEMAANNARVEAARLRNAVVWRAISSEQGNALSSALGEKPEKITLGWVWGDPEGQSLGMQIAAIFQNRGWHVELIAVSDTVFLPFGIHFDGRSAPQAALILSGLSAAKIPFTEQKLEPEKAIYQGNPIKSDLPILLIGSRPVFIPISQ